MAGIKNPRLSTTPRRTMGKRTTGEAKATVALRIAAAMGLLAGPKSRPLNAKVSPRLFQAAAKRAGTTSPAAVINAALAALATEDELGPWLARSWGVLADTPTELLDQIDL
jgi:hypothetical protein